MLFFIVLIKKKLFDYIKISSLSYSRLFNYLIVSDELSIKLFINTILNLIAYKFFNCLNL